MTRDDEYADWFCTMQALSSLLLGSAEDHKAISEELGQSCPSEQRSRVVRGPTYNLDYEVLLSRDQSKPRIYTAWLLRDGQDVAQVTAPTYRECQLSMYSVMRSIVESYGDTDHVLCEEREPVVHWRN